MQNNKYSMNEECGGERKKEQEERRGGDGIKRKNKHDKKEKDDKVLCRSEQLKMLCGEEGENE